MGLNKLFIMTRNMAGGGCERVISILAAGLCAQGVEVSILTEYAHPSAYPLPPQVRLLPLSPKEAMSARDIPGTYAALRRLVRRERPDLVLAMPEKVNVWTVLFLLGTGIPVVVSERNDPRRHPENRIKRLLRQLAYPFAAGFIFQTRQQRDYFSPRIRARGVVLDNPLDCKELPEPYRGQRKKEFVAAGRLEPQKNFPLLIAAFGDFYRRHPDWRLTIYGEGSLKAALTVQAQALGVDGAVSLPGRTEQLSLALLTAGAFVLSSNFEGQPNVLLEAMALGVPCVATDCPVGGPGALIRHGVNGLLTPVGDQAALTEALCRMAEDPAAACNMGAQAAAIRERMDADRVITKRRAYLEQVIR